MQFFEEQKNPMFKKVFIVILALIMVLASFGLGMYLPGKSEAVKELAKNEAVYAGKILGKYNTSDNVLIQDVDFALFWEVWDTLKKEYVDKDKLNEKEMFYGAIKGMVAAAGDPYTIFMDPKIAQEFANDLAGTFEGIGAEIGMRKDVLTIVAPLADSPAEKAGLKAGDKILAIDGENTAGITVEEAVSKIRGRRDTNVILTLFREGMDKPTDFTITRKQIIVKSIKTEKRDDDIYVIKINSFNDDTYDLFTRAVAEVIKDRPKGVILDLRNNPGGYLDTAVEIASSWIEDGVVVTEKFGDDKKNEFMAQGKALLKDYKTVVLVNQGSASASEILAGALKDYGKAVIIGEKTFGKGSVQTLADLEDGSVIKITIAKWLTPAGNNINEQGIEPDVTVELSLDDYNGNKDPQMDKAVETLKNK
ncbi:MAG: S41 family peptidase [Patescibacteria group bacterium]